MNKDTICREDAIDEMERIMADHPLRGYEDELLLINAIKSLPSADRTQGKWRDVTDELPKQGQDVLAWVETKDDARIACCNYSNSIWFDAIMDVIVSPIAWMPLPMPYHKDERSE